MDLIDKRDMREKIARSIIKRQNVNYISREELDRQKAAREAEEAKEREEHLQSEDMSRQKDLDSADRQKGYNAATKSYSGEYGKKMPEDEVSQSQIEKILAEKEQEFMKTLEESFENS